MTANSIHLLKIIIFPLLALIAFAANSVLCRLALGEDSIDAASFTVIRLLAGAAVLYLLILLNTSKTASDAKGSWSASLMLFLYAITFSYAYITLETGTGALILFASVQISMILLSVLSGNRLHTAEWLGIVISCIGFVYLVLPAVKTPSLTGFILMTTAGIAWGVYSLKGRGTQNPLFDTAYNFIRTIPFIIVLSIFTLYDAQATPRGILLAVMSGAIASGIGYAIWYRALTGLSATQAAVVQLLVPVIAAFGGVIFVSEAITLRLVISAIMILGGISIVVIGRYYFIQLRLLNKKEEQQPK